MKKNLFPILIAVLSLPSCQKLESYFTIVWCNYDGSILEIDNNIKEGTIPSYDGNTPEREKDEVYDYEFKSWDKEIKPVSRNETYTATYDSIKREAYVLASHQSGFYDEGFELTLTAPYGYDVYYSLDNSDPDENSLKYEEPILISDASSNDNYYSLKENISSLDVYYPTEKVDKCTLVKVIAINRVSKEKSQIYHYNYFVDYLNKDGYLNMPIVTLNVNDDDLFDYEKGIYVTGKIYDESEHTGYPETYPANYHQKGKEWERKANFKYFGANKELELEQNIGIRIHGGWSRAFNQKSFNLYARKEYSGTSTIGKQFFNGINAHSLMLRSGGYRDTTLTKVRDSLNQDLSKDEGFDTQRSIPTIVFLNGEYWGIYNLQERYSDNYVQEHHDIKKNNVIIIKNDEIDEGSESDYHYYEELKEFFMETSFSSDENYELAKGYFDVNEFASYMATQLYVGNIDWPGNNVRVYKDISSSSSKWHFMMYDTDDSSSILSYKCGPDIDPFVKSSHWKSGPLEDDCLLGLLLSRLIENNQFRTLFRNTFVHIGQEVFSSELVVNYLNEKRVLLRTPMVKSYQRFVNNSYLEEYFDNQISIIRDFFNRRYEYAIGFLNEHIPSL